MHPSQGILIADVHATHTLELKKETARHCKVSDQVWHAAIPRKVTLWDTCEVSFLNLITYQTNEVWSAQLSYTAYWLHYHFIISLWLHVPSYCIHHTTIAVFVGIFMHVYAHANAHATYIPVSYIPPPQDICNILYHIHFHYPVPSTNCSQRYK